MKRLIATVVIVLACGLAGLPLSAQSKLDKLVGKWLMTTDMNGQTTEFTFKVDKVDGGFFATVDMPDAPPQKLEIKEADGKLSSVLDIPEYGVYADITYVVVDDDNVRVTVDAGGFVMENPVTRIKE
ncbi:MAG: hypothetical protein IKH93_07975 [Bacteroidales bacterium]|nr:hypothetical protein [Bacteroidales bacterium]